MKILLVDDSRLFRIVNEKSLSKAGYLVTSVGDGATALATAQQEKPDLIVLDMMLPRLDGVCVLRSLKAEAQTAQIPVVVLSGLTERNGAKLIQEGAAAYLRKSETMLEKNSEVLVQTVREVLQQ